MEIHNQSLHALTSAPARRRFPAWIAALWVALFWALLLAMLWASFVPGRAIYAPGWADALHEPLIGVSLIYGVSVAMASHRLSLWQYAMWGRFHGPGVMFVAGAATAALVLWLAVLAGGPRVLAPVAMTPFEGTYQLSALRRGGQAEDEMAGFFLFLAGQDSQPYEAHFDGFGRFDRVSLDDNLGLTVLADKSFYPTAYPVLMRGYRNALVLVVDDVALLPQ